VVIYSFTLEPSQAVGLDVLEAGQQVRYETEEHRGRLCKVAGRIAGSGVIRLCGLRCFPTVRPAFLSYAAVRCS
jgi:hypothetical protein